MPVNPANQGFPQSGPHAVAPQVIYDQSQKAPYGFLTSTVPGLMNLANLAGGVQKLIEGNPEEDAKVKYYEAGAKESETKAQLQEKSHYTGLADSIRKLPANQRVAAAEALKGVVPPEYHKLLDASTTMGNQEQSAFYQVGYGPSAVTVDPKTWQDVVRGQTTPPQGAIPQDPGARAGIGSDVYSAPGGKGAPQTTPEAPQIKPDPYTTSKPTGQEAPAEKPPFAEIDPYGAPTLASLMGKGKTPEGQSPSPNQMMGPAGEQVARLQQAKGVPPQQAPVGPLVDQGPAPPPYIQTNFGQVPTPQRQFLPPEAAIQNPQAVKPNDILPMAEAHANPQFNQVTDMVYQNEARSAVDNVRGLAASRVFGYIERGEAVPAEDMIMANMDAYAANQTLQNYYQKLGVLPKEAGDLESITKLALYLKTMGKDWNSEKHGNLYEFLKQYQENPALLRAVYPLAKEMLDRDVQLQSALSTLEAERIKAQAKIQGHLIDAESRNYAADQVRIGRLGAAEIQAGWQNARNGIMALTEENKQKNLISDRTMKEIQNLTGDITKIDTRMGALLKQVEGTTLPTGYKQRVTEAATWLRYADSIERHKGKMVEELNGLRTKISSVSFILSNPGTSAPERIQEMGRNKTDMENQAKDLERRISEYDRMLPSIRKRVDDSFKRIDEDPTTQGAKGSPQDPKSAEILSIRSELENLRLERGAMVDLRELLRNPKAMQEALTRQASKWEGAVPSYEDFANSPFPGTNTPIGMHIPEPTLRQYYGFFVGHVQAYQNDKKFGRPDLEGDADNYLDAWTKNPKKVFQIPMQQWADGATPTDLGKNIQYLHKKGFVTVRLNPDGKSWSVKLTPKGLTWVKKKPRSAPPVPEAKPSGYVSPYTEFALPPSGEEAGTQDDNPDAGFEDAMPLEDEE